VIIPILGVLRFLGASLPPVLSRNPMHSLTANQKVLQALTKHLDSRPNAIIDVALIGSVSGHYGWSESRLLDVDVWVLSDDRIGEPTRAWVAELSSAIRDRFDSGVRFESRAIDGPYKPDPAPERDTVLLHLLIDDQSSYRRRSALTRFSWRKYQSMVQADRLLKLSPERPTASDLLSNRWGPISGASAIRDGRVIMEEIDIKNGSASNVAFEEGSFQFREFCTYAVMMGARNRARIEGRPEADLLPNGAFGTWYDQTYADSFVSTIVAYKKAASDGVDLSACEKSLREQSAQWLERLRENLA